MNIEKKVISVKTQKLILGEIIITPSITLFSNFRSDGIHAIENTVYSFEFAQSYFRPIEI